MKKLRRMSLVMAMACAAMGLSNAAQAYDLENDDPDEGDTWVFNTRTTEAVGGHSIMGEMRSNNLLGSIRQREFRIEALGSPGREDRVVTIFRHEPECDELSRLANMSSDDFCDHIRWHANERQINVDFHSYDANRKYRFVLLADGHAPGVWRSQATSGNPEPELTLQMVERDGVVSHEWKLDGVVNETYRQVSVMGVRDVGAMRITSLESGLIALSEILNDFNRFEFERDSLGRENPGFDASPFSAWGEEAVDGGCIGFVCFGSLGTGGDAQNNPCNPRGNNYTPSQCPWDLMNPGWPSTLRPKLWKPANGRYGFSVITKNDGPGEFNYYQRLISLPTFLVNKDMVFATLRRLGQTTPVVAYDPVDGTGTGNCRTTLFYDVTGIASGVIGVIGGLSWPYENTPMPMNGLVPTTVHSGICNESSSRPPGRYRLYTIVDPAGHFDHVDHRQNNVSGSGPVDWIRYK